MLKSAHRYPMFVYTHNTLRHQLRSHRASTLRQCSTAADKVTCQALLGQSFLPIRSTGCAAPASKDVCPKAACVTILCQRVHPGCRVTCGAWKHLINDRSHLQRSPDASMPRELITIQVGQCGNQIGHRFWELALREHAANNSAGLFDEAMSR